MSRLETSVQAAKNAEISVEVKVEKTQVLFSQQRKISHLIAVYNLEETWHSKLILKRIES